MQEPGIDIEQISTLTREMGGEVEGAVLMFEGIAVSCGCGERFKVPSALKGYPHEGGLRDKNGIRWWVFTTCPECGHQFSHVALRRGLRLRRKA